MKAKEKSGISLIVLIITIVIIIILAVAVIQTISKNNPVESAKKATFLNDIASYQDELTMYLGNEYIKENGDFDVSSLDNKPLEEVLEINSKYNEKFIILDGKIVGTDKLTEQEKEWAESITGGTTPQVPAYPSNYTDSDGKKAYIPKDFVVSEKESEKKINTGLVVKDSKGNEFVWVPVEYTSDADFNTKFARKQGYIEGAIQTDYPFESIIEPFSGANQSEKDEHKAMIESVKKYHGYYIARYETSKDASGNVQSKASFAPWTYIGFGNSMTDLTGGAVEKARTLHPVSAATEGSAVSTLIYGVQWDSAINYIEKYGVKNTKYSEDSGTNGNYGASDKANTGSNVAFAQNNIYDMAGNVYEWTMEACENNRRIARGGCYYTDGARFPVSCRIYFLTTVNDEEIGFRIALYIV